MVRENSDDWLNETVQTALHMPLVRMHIDFNQIACKKQTARFNWRKDAANEKVSSIVSIKRSYHLNP